MRATARALVPKLLCPALFNRFCQLLLNVAQRQAERISQAVVAVALCLSFNEERC